MNILLTGSSGFLGQTIKRVLNNNYEIITLGRRNAAIIADIQRPIPALPVCNIIVHAAGEAHYVPQKQIERQRFFAVNIEGTANLLKALENSTLVKSFVFISSVAVYGLEEGKSITERSPLLATDPYGKSKIEAENLVIKWCEKNDVICTIIRLPLIAGTNPPGNLKNMINGIKKNYYFNIDGGVAKKSMVLAEDVAKIIPLAVNIGGIYNLTDGYHPSFSELSKVIAKQLGKPNPLNIPIWLAKPIAVIGDMIGSKAPLNSHKLIKIISELTFDDSKARQFLGWKPLSVLDNFKIE